MAEVDGNSRFQNLCRLCATKTSLVLAINIFESEGAIRQIAKKIQSCLPVQIHEADELPKMVCENCIYKLDLLCDFRDRSMRTERLLLDLFKEINTSRLQTEQEQISVVTMDQNDLIMVQHHQLLNEANLQNVNEIDLAHLGAHRDSMIVEHEIILSHHSLDNIDLNNHELTNQDLSNPSLQTQDGILVGTRNAQRHIEPPRFGEDNLSLMQPEHHLLSYMDNENAVNVNDIHLSSNMKNHSYNAAYEAKIVLMESPNTSNNNFTETKPELSEVNSPESSSNSLLVEETATSLNMTDKQVYVIENNSNEETVQLNGNVSDVKGWYCCNICNKGFDHKLDFDEHYDVHFPKCPTCLALFTTEETLNEHIKVAHVVNTEEPVKTTRLKRATLPLKSESNSEESDMEADTGAVEEEEEIDDPIPNDSNSNKRKKWSPKVCTECGKTYNSNYKLTEHMRKHTGEKPYKCSSCEKAFRSKIGLAQHEAKHTGQYDYSCSTCGKGFQCKSYLMVHQRVHSDVKPYPCTTCGQNFKTKQSLLDHTNRHLGVKPYMCEICGRGFITKGLCKAHQKVHSGLDNRKYPCKICSKMFVSKSYLQTHLRIHTGEKPFKCEVCGKGFLTRVDLRIHSTLHTGEKSYVCEMCGKAFARRDALRCHRRSHTGERPYSCDLCGQTFTQFTPMAIHKRLHTGERPYACEPCGKTFVSKSTMMAHTKKHVR